MDQVNAPPRPQSPQQASPVRSVLGFLAELPLLVAVAFLLALLLKTFLIQAFFIPSESMVPTLQVGDRVLVNKVVYRLREPRRGEVVVFSKDEGLLAPAQDPGSVLARALRSLSAGLGLGPPSERDFIKRIIGLPGDTVAVRDGVVRVNGEPLPERLAGNGGYLDERPLEDYGPTKVPRGRYFMMGDNRDNSADSRFTLGTIPRGDIVGRAFVIIWPVTSVDTLPIPGYGVLARSAAPRLAPAA